MKTLILTVTVRDEDADTVKEALMDALGGDFDAMYSTRERRATKAEADNFEENYP